MGGGWDIKRGRTMCGCVYLTNPGQFAVGDSAERGLATVKIAPQRWSMPE